MVMIMMNLYVSNIIVVGEKKSILLMFFYPLHLMLLEVELNQKLQAGFKMIIKSP
jgi:hypothetical protein